MGHYFKLFTLFVIALVVDTCEFGSNQAEIVVVHVAVSQQLQQPLQRDILLGFTRAWTCYCLMALGHAYGIYEKEAILAKGIGCDVAQLVVANSAHSATLHLDIKRLGSHIAHEYQHFKRFHIRTRCHQRAGDCYAEFLVVAELTYQLVAVARGVGNLLYKLVVCPAKHLLCNSHDIVGVDFVQRENERLGQIIHILLTLRVGEHLSIDSIAIGFQHELDLRRIDDAAVQFLFRVVLRLLVADGFHLARVSCHPSQFGAFQDGSTVLCGLRLDAINAGIHIHAIHDGLLQRVIDHNVVIEESLCFRNRGRRQPYHLGCVEIIQHFFPVAIDGTVALVDDNQVEEVRRKGDVSRQLHFSCRGVFIVIIIIDYFFPCEEREKTLDGGYDHVAIGRHFG